MIDYHRAWQQLWEEISDAEEEGETRGFDLQDAEPKYQGMYQAYLNCLRKMQKIEERLLLYGGEEKETKHEKG